MFLFLFFRIEVKSNVFKQIFFHLIKFSCIEKKVICTGTTENKWLEVDIVLKFQMLVAYINSIYI